MFVTLESFLLPSHLEMIDELLQNAHFIDGRGSAGLEGKTKKDNEEIVAGPAQRAIDEVIQSRMRCQPFFLHAAFGRRISPVIVARYTQGMRYDDHVDAPIQSWGQGIFRKDLSFTIFLDEPDSYVGGELVLDGQQSIKLSRGSAFVYPSTHLHRVNGVTAGQRRVLIGWIETAVKHQHRMEVLNDLYQARCLLNADQRHESARLRALLARAYARVAHEWAEA